MKTRISFLVLLSVLSGCVYKNVYMGPVFPTSACSGSGSAAKFGSGECKSGAEYDTARKKVDHSGESGTDGDAEALEEIVPLDPRYKAGTP
jgi:hypothetical protein